MAEPLKEILVGLGMGIPPPNVTFEEIFSKIREHATVAKKKCDSAGIETEPIFTGTLNENQWKQLEELNNQFSKDYEIRREMLLKRLDVTVESFNWSDRLAEKREGMDAIFRQYRNLMNPKPNVKFSDLLAARADLAIIDKTSSGSVRKHTKSAINSVTIGRVPDRGGRPSEASAPPPEMPSWQSRQQGSVGWKSSRGGGQGGGVRGQGNSRGRGNSQFNDSSGRGGQYSSRGWHGNTHQGYYETNQGWEQGSGYFQHGDRGDHQQNRGHGRGRGGRSYSRVQGGWQHRY